MARYKKMPMVTSVALRFEYQRQGKSTRQLSREYGFPQSTIYRHAVRPIPTAEQPAPVDRRKFNKGRPRLLDARDERNITHAVNSLRESEGLSFSADQVLAESGATCSRKSMSTYLHRLGYKKRQLRKKGQLTASDRRVRVRYARKYQANRRNSTFWKDEVVMYFDGVSFVHKKNPYMKALNHGNTGYRKVSEGLKITAKGSKEGKNGKPASFYVGITYDHGMSFCHQYQGRNCGAVFADFAKEFFPATFNHVQKGNKFVQDGCPVLNSGAVKDAYNDMGYEVISIPARSPDLNPVENIFNLVRRDLRKQAIDQKICNESYDAFCTRVRQTLQRFPVDIINKTIETMAKRLRQVIASQGYRTKY